MSCEEAVREGFDDSKILTSRKASRKPLRNFEFVDLSFPRLMSKRVTLLSGVAAYDDESLRKSLI